MQVPPAQPAPPRMYPPQQPPNNTLRNVLIGCGCLTMTAMLGVFIVVYLFVSGVKSVAKNVGAMFATADVSTRIRESKLPEEDKKKLLERVDQVQQDVVAGKIEFGKAANFGTVLSHSKLLPASTMPWLNEHALKESDLSDEEKARGKLVLDRLTRGLVEGKISTDDLDQILEPLAEPPSKRPGELIDSNYNRLRNAFTDPDVKAFLEKAEKLVGERDIPDAPFEIDIPKEFAKEFDQAMQDLRSGK